MAKDKDPAPSMSDILVAFASPLLNPDMSVQAYEGALKLAAAIWNLAFLPPEKFDAGRKQMLDRFMQGNPQEAIMWANTIDRLINMRRQVFAGDGRFLTAVAVVQRNGRWDVQTDYTLIGAPGAAPAGDAPAGG